MKTWIRVFLFLMAFQLEVRVKAGILQTPENCLRTEAACAVKAVNGPLHVDTDKLVLHATTDSVVEKESVKDWRFIKGNLWVE